LASENSFAFFLVFCMLQLSARKLHNILFLKNFYLKEMFIGQVHFAILLRPRVWVGRRQPPTGRPADYGIRMARPWTVVPVHKLLLKTPNNPRHVTEVYVTCYCFYSSTRDIFRVAIRLYLFSRHVFIKQQHNR